VEILLERMKDGTRLTLRHSNIPEGQAESYKQGWEDFYFKPMKEYFK
jgi:activator of HSP90 ATPase